MLFRSMTSGVYLHGDENNANVPDGNTVIGSGKIGGYGVVNLQSTWHATQAIDLFVKLDNVFNKHYATSGFLTSNALNDDGSFRADPDDWRNENLVAPGAPTSIFVGARLHIQ